MKSLFFLVLLASCSFRSNVDTQPTHGHEELYSELKAPEPPSKNEKRIVIAATNDFKGQFRPRLIEVKDKNSETKQTIGMGGLPYISSYFKILREKYQNVLLLDSGNIFSADPNIIREAKEFYQALNYDALTVGLNDFNVKLPSGVVSNTQLFQKFAEGSKTPLILSNLYDLRTARVVEWKGTAPYLMKDFQGIKVGVIGLVADDIVDETPVDNRVGLFVEGMIQSTLRQARLLRTIGADLIVVMTNQGLGCGEAIAREKKLPLTKVNFDPHKEGVCRLQGILGDYLQRLPPDLVDLVIGGRNGQKMANFINGTLVMSGFPEGQSFSYVEFFFDHKTKAVIKEKTRVHQPVLFCHEFFKETSDCYPEDPSVNHDQRIPATFLGEEIGPDPSVTLFTDPRSEVSAPLDLPKTLDTFGADIAYLAELNDSQLYLSELSGKDLISILEEDYNFGREALWKPNPFQRVGEKLSVSFKGSAVEPTKIYRVLSNLVDLQKHRRLKKNISHSNSRALMNHSWNSVATDLDEISTQLAGFSR